MWRDLDFLPALRKKQWREEKGLSILFDPSKDAYRRELQAWEWGSKSRLQGLENVLSSLEPCKWL